MVPRLFDSWYATWIWSLGDRKLRLFLLQPQSQGDRNPAEVDELDSDQGACDSDTEDAALVLEELGE